MNRDQKAAVIDEIAAEITESQAVYAVDSRGMSVPQAAEVRAKLRDAGTTFRVVKNSLTERAADKAGAEALKDLLEGPTALAFVRGDVAQIKVPTLVIHGDADQILPLDATGKRTAALIPGAQLHVVEGGPHGLNWTHATEVNKALLTFLK